MSPGKVRRGTDPGTSESAAVDLGSLPRLTGFALRRAQLAVFEEFITAVAELGLRPASFSALVVIHRNPGRKQSEIAAALGIRQANFVGLMDELANRGLAVRTRVPEDRRSHALTLTTEGEAVLARAMVISERHERRMIARLGGNGHDKLLETLALLTGDRS